MKTRSVFIAAILAFAAALACVPQEQPGFRAHVLDRIAYGADAWSRARVEMLGGVSAYIEEQLYPKSIPNGSLNAMLDAYPTLDLSFAERVALSEGTMPGMPMMSDTELWYELRDARILRSVYSRRQLEEMLVDFWFNHFNILATHGVIPVSAAPYERIAIRRNVLGRFEDMLVAVARSPAMLVYLDNWHSLKMDESSAKTRMNENYARELLELHTLGVDNYTQQDVEEVARCFTGWTIDETVDDGFYFWAEEHDTGSKLIFGELLVPAGGGMTDGTAVLSYLAQHPTTAENIARKLIQRFVTEDPPQSLVNRVRDHFLATDGDLREVMRVILYSSEFASPSNFKTKMKRPFVFATSTARALGTTTEGVIERIEDLTNWAGEPFYRERSPTGFPDASDAWMGVGSLMERVNFAHHVVRHANGFTFDWVVQDPGDDALLVERLEDWLLLAPLSDGTRSEVLDYGSLLAPHVTGQRRVEELSWAILTSPEFFLH